MADTKQIMKTLDDVKRDMSFLYDAVKSGNVDLKTAAELANISGKYLKAEQLKLARDIFLDNKKPAQMKELTE
jgi:hypothetical protein